MLNIIFILTLFLCNFKVFANDCSLDEKAKLITALHKNQDAAFAKNDKVSAYERRLSGGPAFNFSFDKSLTENLSKVSGNEFKNGIQYTYSRKVLQNDGTSKDEFYLGFANIFSVDGQCKIVENRSISIPTSDCIIKENKCVSIIADKSHTKPTPAANKSGMVKY